MNILLILKAAREAAEIILPILGWLGKRRAQKKAKKVTAALSSVILGVEQFSMVNKNCSGMDVKTYIQSRAQADGSEKDLNPIVKKLTK